MSEKHGIFYNHGILGLYSTTNRFCSSCRRQMSHGRHDASCALPPETVKLCLFFTTLLHLTHAKNNTKSDEIDTGVPGRNQTRRVVRCSTPADSCRPSPKRNRFRFRCPRGTWRRTRAASSTSHPRAATRAPFGGACRGRETGAGRGGSRRGRAAGWNSCPSTRSLSFSNLR